MTTDEPQSGKLPLGALLALAMTGFICIVTETLPRVVARDQQRAWYFGIFGWADGDRLCLGVTAGSNSADYCHAKLAPQDGVAANSCRLPGIQYPHGAVFPLLAYFDCAVFCPAFLRGWPGASLRAMRDGWLLHNCRDAHWQ